MATAPYNYSYIFKYIIIGKYEVDTCLSVLVSVILPTNPVPDCC